MTDTVVPPRPRVLSSWGLWAVICGAFAVAFVFAHIQLLSAASADAPSIGQQIGEIAGEARRAAWRSFFGLPQPVPEPVVISPARRAAELMEWAVPILSTLAIICAAISVARRERLRLAVWGATLGGGALVFLYLWWMALLIVACVVIVAILHNIGDIFGG